MWRPAGSSDAAPPAGEAAAGVVEETAAEVVEEPAEEEQKKTIDKHALTQAWRKSKIAEGACSMDHLMTHEPKCPQCDVCLRSRAP